MDPSPDFQSDDNTLIAGLRERVAELERSEQQLRQCRERFRMLTANLPGVVYLCRNDAHHTMLYVNEAAEQLTGYPREDFLEGRVSTVDLYHPDDRDRVLAEATARLAEGRGFRLVYRVRHRSGAWRWVQETAEPVVGRFDGDEEQLVQGFLQDITEQREAEQTLRHRVAFEKLITSLSRQFIDLRLDDLDAGIDRALGMIGRFAEADRSYVFQFHDEGRLMSCTHEWCSDGIDPQKDRLRNIAVADFPWIMSELRRQETFYIDRVADIPDSAASERASLEAQSIQSLVAVPLVYRDRFLGFVGLDSVRSERRWSQVEWVTLHLVGEMLTHVLERQRAERAAHDYERWFNAVVNNAPLLLCTMDRNGIITLTKGAGLRLLRTEPDRHAGMSALALYEDWPELIEHIKRGIRGETFEVTTELFGRLLELKFQPMFGDDGGLQGTIALAIDITERMRLQKQLLQAQKLESIGTLAGGIAHDYNNLLAVIIGNATVHLRDDKLNEKVRESLRDILDAAERGSDLSHQLLAYAHGGWRAMNPVHLGDVVRNVLQLLQRTVPSQLALLPQVSPDLPSMMADVGQIEQVLMNLCLNAIQASEAPAAVDVRARPVTVAPGDDDRIPPGDYVLLQVEDHGEGMRPETRERIFEPFFTTKATGRGMGLSAAMGIIERHGGHIRVYSEPGQGTTVSVWLPCSEPAGTESRQEKRQIRINPARGTETIVVVDDEPAVLRTVDRILRSLGYIVITHDDGEAAKAFLETHAEDIDLVIADMNMPGCSGAEILSHAARCCPGVPVVLASGFDSPRAPGDLRIDGAAGFVQKPFSLMSLAHAVREALDGDGGTTQLES